MVNIRLKVYFCSSSIPQAPTPYQDCCAMFGNYREKSNNSNSYSFERNRRTKSYLDSGVLRPEAHSASETSREACFLESHLPKRGESGEVGEGIIHRETASTGARKYAMWIWSLSGPPSLVTEALCLYNDPTSHSAHSHPSLATAHPIPMSPPTSGCPTCDHTSTTIKTPILFPILLWMLKTTPLNDV